MDDVLEELERKMDSYIEETQGGAVCIYVCWPGTPDGRTGSIDKRNKFIQMCEEKGMLNIWDEAFGDYLPDEESAVKHTEKNKTTIVLRSPSKALGIPGERIGIAIMHRVVGEAFKKIRLPHDVSSSVQIIAGNFLNPKIINPYLEDLRRKEVRNKEIMLELAGRAGISYLDTDVRVPITAFDGGTPLFHQELLNLGIITASGHGFRGTYPGLSGRIVRVRTPRTQKDIYRLVRDMKDAKGNAIVEARLQDPAEIHGRYTGTVIGLPTQD
jgi:histidinol-phosphate aminotransferase